ncbi:MAG TPA: hypothetical protein VMX18_02000 [Candidatus Bipolaricaulota bacterium]|nr:hypothetical protein [Candidatus Bipolaricaulota bacterium]
MFPKIACLAVWVCLAIMCFGCRQGRVSNETAVENPPETSEPDDNCPVRIENFSGLFFDCPDGWMVATESERVVSIKNTDREVMLSAGFAPEDYFLPSGNVNDEKYADQYALIRLESFDFQIERVGDWQRFLSENAPEISAFEEIELDNGLTAIEPTGFSGALLGDEALIISLPERVVIAALHTQGWQPDAHATFLNLVNGLR